MAIIIFIVCVMIEAENSIANKRLTYGAWCLREADIKKLF